MPGVVVVTGAGAGVGRATAVRFAREGGRVALIARGADGLAGARRDVESAGGTALEIQADVADPNALDAAADRVEAELGEIDVWVNNAMTTVFAPFDEIEPDEYRRATEVTYLGAVWGTRAALGRMLPRDRGTIVQVSSALAHRGIPLQAPYCGAKHAIKGFTESLRCELRHRSSRVHVTTVELPAVNTPQFEHCRSRMPRHPMPVPPIFQPELAADAIAFAARSRRRSVVVGLPTAKTIWGNRLAPGVAERYLARTGFDAQQDDAPPTEAHRAGNLFEPQPGDHGGHGRFDNQAQRSSGQFWLSRHRRALAVAGAAAVCLIGVRARVADR